MRKRRTSRTTPKRSCGIPLLFALVAAACVIQTPSAIADPNRPFREPAFEKARPAPPFKLQQESGRWWLCAPDGHRFFSLGVCCLRQETAPEEYDPERPSYSALRHYPDADAWATSALERLKQWRFTTVGGWSDYATLRRSPEMDFAITPVLAIGATAGAPWWDMWSEEVLSRMDQRAREQILPLREDPRLLGYYTDNELGWWNAALFQITLKQKPESTQRQRLLRLLREHYRSDWNALLADFDPEGAADFAALERSGQLYLRPNGDGIRVMRKFLEMMADRYYAVTREIIRKYDERGLILGDRYQSFYYPEVARAASRHVDVVSANLNANWGDGTFVRFYLPNLYALTGKPLVISEFYAAATENQSGNLNSQGLFPVAATQQERADAFAETLTTVARLPYVVAADWFQYADEPPAGRPLDGEDYNMGLVDIRDQPYRELTTRASTLDLRQLKVAGPLPQRDAREGVPRAMSDPLTNFTPRLALQHWDRQQGFVPPFSETPLADLYLCWDADALYLGLYAIDPVEPGYYRDEHIPEVDRMEWTVQLGEAEKPIQVRLGAGREPTGMPAGVVVRNLSGLEVNVRVIAVMKIPAAGFSEIPLRLGDRIQLKSRLLTHARAYEARWEGEFTLGETAVTDNER